MKTVFAAAVVMLAGLAGGCATDSCGSCCAAEEAGFVQLFNGKDLSGWTGGVEAYEVVDGTLMSKPGGKGNLLTEQTYDDFDLRLEFKLTPAANNGVGIRLPKTAKATSYEGMEIQVLDDAGYKATKPLKEWQHCGSLYGCVAAKQGHVKAPGEWNEMRIVAKGPSLQVFLNGELVTDAKLDELKPVDGKEHPGLKNKGGHIGFLGHNDVVYFRNIRVKSL